MAELLSLLAIGVVVGFAGGSLGVGGGFLLVPVLFGIAGWSLIASVATSHFCGLAVSTSATGPYARARLIDWRVAVILEVPAVAGSVLGAWSARWISTSLIAMLFCVVALYSAIRMWLSREPSSPQLDRAATQIESRSLWLGCPAIFLVGAASGILGLGGGVFMVPIMTVIIGMPLRRAVGTSVFMVGLNGAAAGAVYYVRGDVMVDPTSILVVGVFAGAYLGAMLQYRMPTVVLKRAFAVMLVVLAIRLALKAAE